MATKFDPQEYAKQRFLTIGTKYFPKDHLRINTSKRKGFRLADSTISLIKQSIDIVTSAQESRVIIPASTANICRYGAILIDIFENLNEYQMISQLKSRSRRGYRKELEVIDFDLKKIELKLKKSVEPPIRIQKDEKMIRDIKKYYLKQLETDEFQDLFEDAIKKQDLFVLSDSDGKKFFESLLRQLNTINAKISEKEETKSYLVKVKGKISDLKIRITELEKNLPSLKDKAENIRKKSGIFLLLSEKEKLLADPDLSLFLKIITSCIERYVKMIERRENRMLDQREDLLGLVLEPTRFKGLNEDLWRQIVFIVETHGFELISSKNWFNFTHSDELRNFIIKKEILEKYAGLRKLEEKLDEIEKKLANNPQYSEATRLIQEFDEKKTLYSELKEEIPNIKEKIATLSHDIKIDKEQIVSFLL
ncbi:MAG: hypothetical protein ACFFAU_05050 [Candidatus Hodarchaeota archaeon]